ncbi:GNAT family N-acetyltransferase [Agrobacterium rubi]|uniref:GNAT family N-acetyltransferase n=2 Tax=Agrobacterium rubi TaxID=28099 RepID=A0AAE7URV9_9HYPH|nr:GNAT family N-acetyltransferase [Agrobacterium rubi]NTE86014.1 GNAT family N-acetyltransferase [Agrobacterium rubi]NTF01945.1 GNAT family N-acetyltransferase [Agrobacterium rubi]NTF36189.1 GNAT family N-acetyltransferase [Agrobacterium rubi]OCJ54779.1 acetyltransferase [Agrobacterium rubi]QTG01661.1 GNAT family N-acetyltransferase [Agrobacterium rubi]
MTAVQNEIFATGLRKTPRDIETIVRVYLQREDNIECTVAENVEGRILGFQSLTHARPGNPYGVAEGWGIIGTHVSPAAARQGVGSALFRATLAAAKAAELENIDASIGADNLLGQAYYEAMGFRTYRTPEGLVCKVYRVG